jgi:hypothetical protein
MTQELIANMLGVRREGVTEAAGKLQQAGLPPAQPHPKRRPTPVARVCAPLRYCAGTVVRSSR